MSAKRADLARNAITGLYQDDLPMLGLDEDEDFGRWDEFEGTDEATGKPFSHQQRWHGPKGKALTTLWGDGTMTVKDLATGQAVLTIDMRRPIGA